MPHMAQQMDKIAVIRSMRTSEVDHPGGIYLMHTGYRPSATVRFPEVGAIVAKYQGRPGKDLPDFIKVSSQGDAGAGFLGPRYQPFGIGSKGDLPPFTNSSLAKEVESRRHELRSFVEAQYTQDNPSQLARMHHEAYEAARRLQSVQQKFKLDAEWDKYRELYGDSGFGRRCLLARKLVESGVAFIEVGQSSYDSHADNASWHKGLVPPMEQAWAGLLTDLKDRGLLDNTLVVWTGEIGRTPKINNRAGRDHYVRCWSTALAGCGIKEVWSMCQRRRWRGSEGLTRHRGRFLRYDLPIAIDQSARREFRRCSSGAACAVWFEGGDRFVGVAPSLFLFPCIENGYDRLVQSKADIQWHLTFEGAWPTAVALLPSGKQLVAGNEKGELFVWDLPADKFAEAGKNEAPSLAPVRQLVGHTNGITRIVALPGGHTIATASLDHTIRLWDLNTATVGTSEVVLDRESRERKTKKVTSKPTRRQV